jgi:hypothetical protein
LPTFAASRQLEPNGEALSSKRVRRRHDVAGRILMRHVVDARAYIDQRLEHGVSRHVRDALAIHPDIPIVANRLPVFISIPDH